MEKVIAGKTIHVNEEGFMTDFKEWDNTIGEALAAENEISLSPRHWKYWVICKQNSRMKCP